MNNRRLSIEKILEQLRGINQKINAQIPLVANRYEYFDPLKTATAEEKLALEQEYDQLCIDWQEAELEYHVYKNLKEIFDKYLYTNQLNRQTVSEVDKKRIAGIASAQANLICQQMTDCKMIIGEEITFDREKITAYIDNNSSMILEKLIQNEPILISKQYLENKFQFTRRVQLEEQLVYDRMVRKKLISNPANFNFSENESESVLTEQWRKQCSLLNGCYMSTLQCTTGYCGELTDYALFLFFSLDLMEHIETLEVICNEEVKDGKVTSNHMFLAINRPPNSDLNDISTWGKGILWDPWNQMVCFGEDYTKLPHHYECYNRNRVWKSTVFTAKDQFLFNHLHADNIHYEMTGNRDLATRAEAILDEYALVPINNHQNPHTYDLLNAIIAEVKPVSFNCPVDLFITNQNDKIISSIPGLKNPSLAIHKDFFTLIQNGQASINDLKLCLASALYEMKHIGIVSHISNDPQFFSRIDRDLLNHLHHGDSLINYLRLCIQFSKNHKSELHTMDSHHLQTFAKNNLNDAMLEQRIKAIKTFLAREPSHSNNDATDVEISPSVYDELASIKPAHYFWDGFLACKDIVSKINYLRNCLPELKRELKASEMELNMFSRRIHEFIAILTTIKIDFTNDDQWKAADQLIADAFRLRVPGITKIYKALTKHVDGYKVPALGPFVTYNQLIAGLNDANNHEQALNVIKNIMELLQSEFGDHIYKKEQVNIAQCKFYNANFYKKHKRYPTGSERFFGSAVGSFVLLAPLNSTIIDQLLTWAVAYRDKTIVTFLLMNGIFNDAALEVLTFDEIKTITSQANELTIFDDKNEQKSSYIREYIRTHTKVDDSMFALPIPFKQQLNQYIHANINLLYYDPLYPFCGNNDAVDLLLRKFIEIIKTGADDDKKIVKDFFLNHTIDGPSLLNVQYLYDNSLKRVELESHYARFILMEELLDEKFDFFTVEEKIAFIYQCKFANIRLPEDDYPKLLKSPFEPASLACLEYMIDNLLKCGIDLYHPLVPLLENHLQMHGSYSFNASDTLSLLKLGMRVKNQSIDINYTFLQRILENTPWDLPISLANVSVQELLNYILIYHCYNALSLFITPEEQIRFGQILLDKINTLSADDKIACISKLIFSNEFDIPITDHKFKNHLIDLFVQTLLQKFGIDDNSSDYLDQVMPHIMMIMKNATKSNKELVLSKLFTAIEAQVKICTIYTVPEIRSVRFKTVYEEENGNNEISGLSAISLIFSKTTETQLQFIDFFSKPLTEQSVEIFCNHLLCHQHSDLVKLIPNFKNLYNNQQSLRFLIKNLYFKFWDLTIAERAVIFDHLLIPAHLTKTEEIEKEAYQKAFAYIGNRLFPNANDPNADDHFALALLSAYLENCDKHQRGILLAGMLVATNEVDSAENVSTGKKFAKLCEHMGPAYIKLAQAISLYPRTPPSLKKDLAHVKGHANPPHRWQIWELIKRTVPMSVQQNITHVGKLLGSASYNLAVEVTLKDGQQAVLVLLRENAAKDANQGFTHLKATIKSCDHARIQTIREPAHAILSEAERLSIIEMDATASQQQFAIAQKIYREKRFNLAEIDPRLKIKACQALASGPGYRLIDKAEGIEFNELPTGTTDEIKLKKTVAKAVIKMELINILSGNYFDSDRHGSQLRVHVDKHITLGLFDWGEMALKPPTKENIQAFAAVIRDLPNNMLASKSFDVAFEETLSAHIDKTQDCETQQYLMRIRKALLALQDFQTHLSNDELFKVLESILDHPVLHKDLNSALKASIWTMKTNYMLNTLTSYSGSFTRMLKSASALGQTIMDGTKKILEPLTGSISTAYHSNNIFSSPQGKPQNEKDDNKHEKIDENNTDNEQSNTISYQGSE